MKKGNVFSVIFLSLLCCCVSKAFAIELDLFESKCLCCHGKGEVKYLDPSAKSAAAWERYLLSNKHPVDLTDKISQDEMQKLLAFFKAKSAGVEQPASAVIPNRTSQTPRSASIAVEDEKPAIAIIPK